MDGGEIPGSVGRWTACRSHSRLDSRSFVISARGTTGTDGMELSVAGGGEEDAASSLTGWCKYFLEEEEKDAWYLATYLCLNTIQRISGRIQREKIPGSQTGACPKNSSRPHFSRQPLPTYTHRRETDEGCFEDLQQERQKQPKETMPTSLLFPCASIFLTECLSVCYRVTHFPIFSFAVVFPPSNGPFVSAKPVRTPFPSHLALRFLFFHHLSQDLWLPGSDVPSTTTTTTPESTTKKETRHPRLVPSSHEPPPCQHQPSPANCPSSHCHALPCAQI